MLPTLEVLNSTPRTPTPDSTTLESLANYQHSRFRSACCTPLEWNYARTCNMDHPFALWNPLRTLKISIQCFLHCCCCLHRKFSRKFFFQKNLAKIFQINTRTHALRHMFTNVSTGMVHIFHNFSHLSQPTQHHALTCAGPNSNFLILTFVPRCINGSHDNDPALG
jgi:hypothetical protein